MKIKENKKLAESLRNGNPQAFEEMFLVYWKPLLYYGINICQSLEDCEEAAQESFINLWEHKRRIVSICHAESLLFGRVKRKLIDIQRKKMAQKRWEDSVMVEEENGLSRERELDYQKVLSKVISYIDNLKPNLKSAIELTLYGLNGVEAAQICHTTGNAVNISVSRARKLLKDLLNSEEYNEYPL